MSKENTPYNVLGMQHTTSVFNNSVYGHVRVQSHTFSIQACTKSSEFTIHPILKV